MACFQYIKTFGEAEMNRSLFAEAIGTFMLVGAVLGAALVSGNAAGLGVALCIGLTVMVMAYAVGPMSGGHFNPAVTIGLFAAGRFNSAKILPYVAAQIAGGIAAALFFAFILSSKGALPAGFASNGYGEHSPGGYSLIAALLMEIVQTAIFIFIIARVTRKDGAGNLAPVAIGLALAAMHLISIPVANTSLNPARSIATAVIEGGWALNQLWLFILAPLAGGYIGGAIDKLLGDNN
jgi:aquaporin Z